MSGPRLNTLRCRSVESCPKVAAALIITESQEVEGQPKPRTLSVLPACIDHAHGEAGRAASTLDNERYLILQMPPFGVGELT